MRLFGNANYDYIRKARYAYAVSGTFILIGIVGMVINVFTIGSWQEYGVEFTGGTLVQVAIPGDVTVGQVRDAVPTATEVTRFEGANDFIIRAPAAEGVDVEQVSLRIDQELAAAFGADNFRIDRTEVVGPVIGAELQQKALLATLFSLALMLVYLAIRFEFRFGVAAVIATVHDVLIVLGFMAVFRVEVALPIVAAILTTVGYSVNDTIVIFDRIRENRAKKGGRKENQIDLIDRSINETLPRTVLTGGTTLAALLALLVLGPAVIRDFAMVMCVGLFAGILSTIFIASPALLDLAAWWEGRKRKKGPGEPRRKEPATV